jgi:hypothetical protein
MFAHCYVIIQNKSCRLSAMAHGGGEREKRGRRLAFARK